jgi:RNase P/RNase MRP subunit POP5
MEKNRYVVFQVDKNEKADFTAVKKAIITSALSFLGELEIAKSGFLILPDWKNNQGIIKVSPKYVDKIRASLALVKKPAISTIKVSGTLKKARGG